MRLSPRDLERWQNAVLALHRLQTTDDFDRALPEILLRLIAADWFFLLEYAVMFGLVQGHAGCFHFARRRDFTERDRTLLSLLRPHVQLARRNAEQWTAWTRAHRVPDHRAAVELTPREAEIARWLAAGKTNPEIALILQSRARTVEKHVERILQKLRVENRTAAAVMLAGSSKGASLA